MENTIVTFGELLLRLSKPGLQRLCQGSTFTGDYGGSEANVSVSLACLGDNVTFLSRLPHNVVGDAALMHLRGFGVDVSHVVRGGDRLGSYYFEKAAAMRNSHVVYDRKDSSFYTLRRGMIPWQEALRGASLFHCSGITCAISDESMRATFDGVDVADRMGLAICCDINYRKNLWNYGASAHDVLFRLLQHSDVIFGDQNEWEVASGVPHIPFEARTAAYTIDRAAYRDYFRRMHALFPRCRKMIMALRNQLESSHHILTGLLYDAAGDALFTARLYDIEPVVDPMGVGDAFVAAYLHAFRRWGDDNQRCLDFGLSASAMKNTIPGDQNLVSESEIIANIAGSGGRIQR